MRLKYEPASELLHMTVLQLPTPECLRGCIPSKTAQEPVSTLENHFLEGKLTFGDYLLDSSVGHLARQRYLQNGPVIFQAPNLAVQVT